MSSVHLHLLANHIPIIGAFFGFVVLLFGMVRKSPPTLAAAYLVFILAAVGGLASYFSGEGAEEAVELLPGVSKAMISEHEEMANYTLWVFVLLALMSLFGLFRSRDHYNKIRNIAVATLVVSIVGFGIATYTGLIGGQIRHTEVRNAATEKHAQEEHGEKQGD